MKNCPNCSKEIQEDFAVCPWCGMNLTLPAPGGTPVEVKTSGKAIASLVLGIFPVIPLFGSIVAVVFGHISLNEIGKSAGRLKGKGMAIAGLVLGYIGIAVIPFILIVAAIAIPNLLRARMMANQASAVGSLHTINTAELTYAATYSENFSPDLQSLDGSAQPPTAQAAGLIDNTLASGLRSGYKFTYAPGPPDANGAIKTYTVHADPVVPNNTGLDYYFTDQSGVIRRDREKPADENSPPMGE